MEQIRELLRHQTFFSRIDSKFLDLLVECASTVNFKAGDVIFSEGDQAENFYLLCEGQVALYLDSPGRGELVIQTVGESEIVGWSWLVPPNVWTFSAKAVERTRAIAFDGDCVLKACEENHEFGYQLVTQFSRVIARRLQATRLQLLDLYAAPNEKR